INPSNTGLAKRALAMEKRIEQMDKVDKPTVSRKMTEEFNSGGYAAKEVVSFDSVYKSYGTNILLNDVDLSISKNDSIALIGANGCGKTTLLKMIMGEESCNSGIIKVSSNIKIAYMSQIIIFEDESATVLDTLRNVIALPEDKLRSILAGFKFRASDVLKQVSNLSGGEKSRLKLCILMQEQVNFLILDEPTNHLDIDSREWIEEAVSEFEGTMLFISHDRYFLNKFATKIWGMKDGAVTEYIGSFEDYQKVLDTAGKRIDTSSANKKKKKSPTKAKFTNKSEKSQVSYESCISEAEAMLMTLEKEIEAHLADSDYGKMDELYQKKYQIEEQISNLYDEWANVEK
ncbi:MAG: ATP-binding cassette domain-containing protein, partial [Oscillospiraceae bacterium]|nr:ATP-binding cassette domain-containing protein [Oscillospiraceae bacterium]